MESKYKAMEYDKNMKGITENLKKFNWGKLENGRYSIFQVPVFKIFEDTEHGKVDEKDARMILRNFQEGKKNGFYPRIHIGHNPDNSTDNREGAGFLDNLQLKNGVFFADLVELSPNIIKDVQNLKYPSRSVEFNGEKKKIMGLALLESQPPFFQFPILALEANEIKLDKFQLDQAQIRKFSLKGNKQMADIEKTDKEKVDMVEGEKDSLGSCQMKYQEMHDNIGAKIAELAAGQQEIKDILGSLVGIMEKLAAGEEEETKTEEVPEPIDEESTESQQGQKPGSVAFQLAQLHKDMITLTKYQINQSKYQGGTPAVKNMTSKFNDRSPLQKFQGESSEIQKVAREAFQDWTDTMNQSDQNNVRKFQAIYPDPEKYIQHVVECEKITPGYSKRMTY